MAERKQNSFVEPRLFELTAKAKEAKEALTQASEEISSHIRDRRIGEIYEPAEFKNALVGILDHPLATTIRSAREQRASIAVSVAREIRDGNLLYQIEEELRQNRSAVESAEGAVKEGILPEDILILPNVGHFRTRAQDYQLMLELYEMGIGFLPADVTAVVPPPEKPVVPQEMAGEAERRKLLRMIHIRDQVKGVISIGDQQIHLRSKGSRQTFYRLVQDLRQPWDNNLGMHSQEVKSIAEDNGYRGKSPSAMPIRRLNEVFSERNLPIHIASVEDPKNGIYRYYRIRVGVMPKRAVTGRTVTEHV